MTVHPGTDNDAESAPPNRRPTYLDHAATTPVDPRVAEEVLRFMVQEFGNAGSRTHSYGQDAKKRVNRARQEVADVVDATPDEVIFTSGATESNNLAILGLRDYAERSERRHIVSTAIEHKAVLEPLEHLRGCGFEVELVRPTRGGWVDADAVAGAVRPDTALVSVMAVNNETGVKQPVQEIAASLEDGGPYFHVDGAQAFGKTIEALRDKRIDLISVSGHKIGAPKGVGALITRRRGYKRPPLQPLMFGGGQERGLRPGTIPVALVAGLGSAARYALQEHDGRVRGSEQTKSALIEALRPLGAVFNGDPDRAIANTLNFSIPGIDSEAAIVALKDAVAISNGSACTSQKYEASHVLAAANIPPEQIDGAIRVSWDVTTTQDWVRSFTQRLSDLR